MKPPTLIQLLTVVKPPWRFNLFIHQYKIILLIRIYLIRYRGINIQYWNFGPILNFIPITNYRFKHMQTRLKYTTLYQGSVGILAVERTIYKTDFIARKLDGGSSIKKGQIMYLKGITRQNACT